MAWLPLSRSALRSESRLVVESVTIAHMVPRRGGRGDLRSGISFPRPRLTELSRWRGSSREYCLRRRSEQAPPEKSMWATTWGVRTGQAPVARLGHSGLTCEKDAGQGGVARADCRLGLRDWGATPLWLGPPLRFRRPGGGPATYQGREA